MIRIILTAIIIFLFAPSGVVAEIKEIVSEGSYNMGDGETPTVAESRALLKAKQIAIEQAGTYVENYSKVQGIVLTNDETHVLTSGLIEVNILDRKRSVVDDGINFWVKISARINLDKIETMEKKVREKLVIEDYKKLQKEYAKSQAAIEQLKAELRQAKDKKKKSRIETAIHKDELAFKASEWFAKGRSYALNDEADKAIEAYGKVIEMNDDAWRIGAYVNRAIIFADRGQLDKSVEDFSKAIDIYYNYVKSTGSENQTGEKLFYNRGISYRRQSQFDLAIADLSKAISLKPAEAANYNERGKTYIYVGKQKEAIKDFNKAIAINPQVGSYYTNRGVAYWKMGQLDSALSDFNVAVSKGDDNAYIKRGTVLIEQGKYDLAVEDLGKAISKTQKNSLAYMQRGTAYAMMKEYDHAISDFNMSIVLEADNASAYYNRGAIYYLTNKHVAAISDFKKACELGHKGSCNALQ